MGAVVQCSKVVSQLQKNPGKSVIGVVQLAGDPEKAKQNLPFEEIKKVGDCFKDDVKATKEVAIFATEKTLATVGCVGSSVAQGGLFVASKFDDSLESKLHKQEQMTKKLYEEATEAIDIIPLIGTINRFARGENKEGKENLIFDLVPVCGHLVKGCMVARGVKAARGVKTARAGRIAAKTKAVARCTAKEIGARAALSCSQKLADEFYDVHKNRPDVLMALVACDQILQVSLAHKSSRYSYASLAQQIIDLFPLLKITEDCKETLKRDLHTGLPPDRERRTKELIKRVEECERKSRALQVLEPETLRQLQAAGLKGRIHVCDGGFE